ncbi:type II secretion system protein [Sulfurospirillum diekertiae]|uniref:Type II secretion system protein n=1 Tax=Sulfurospirillum diekertiae TaxID=1854492 RepID=A0A6G9VW45_9BACT|nr:type II secretion system protein [Sulfurospirillum diekertiae]QIR76902.1 type II secretion system protein [Sulfurospirillum diekertiae]QIR79520.1 type II secretion system protein [Sulfurospirillum diekertiae]
MRRGFTLITAIIFMVLVASIAALSLSFSSFSTKQTTDLYLREQAELLVQSGTEFALLAISGHDINATSNCINSIISQYPTTAAPLFDINITINYMGSGLPAGCNILSNAVVTSDSNITVIIDTIVEDHNISTEPIRLHRRTIQKP